MGGSQQRNGERGAAERGARGAQWSGGVGVGAGSGARGGGGGGGGGGGARRRAAGGGARARARRPAPRRARARRRARAAHAAALRARQPRGPAGLQGYSTLIITTFDSTGLIVSPTSLK